jgi:predicted AlkP superfamily pyrophosphatase or phosphodiesterase
MTITVRLLDVLGIVCCCLAGSSWARPVQGHPVLLISVDGMRPNDVFNAEDHGIRLPTLQRMIVEGTSARAVRNVTPTITLPNHTTLITGTLPSEHGFYDNVVFDPLRRRTDRYFWYAQDIKVQTLWDAVKSKGGMVASLYWPGTVGADSIDVNVPLYWRDMDLEDIKQIAALSTPRLVGELEHATGRKLVQSMLLTPAADRVIGEYAAYVLTSRHPRLLTVHLSAFDHVAHVYGPDSPEAHAALENTDAVIGAIQTAGRKAIPGLVVAVVSDHGFAPLHDDVNVLKAFVDAGLAKVDPATGQFVDWQAMPWGYASAAVFLARPLDPDLQARTADVLARIVKDPAYHVQKIVDLTGSAAFKAGRSPAYYIDFEAGYEMGQSLGATMLTPSKYKGMHGYLNDMEAMHSAFFMSGPTIAHGKNLGEIDMLDIAPTLAAVLGTVLPQASGKPLFNDREVR